MANANVSITAVSDPLLDTEPQMIIAPSFAQSRPPPIPEGRVYASAISSLGSCLGLIGSIPLLICFPNPYKVVPQGEVGLITRWGTYYRTVDSGMYSLNPLTEKMLKVNIKIQIEDIPSQFVMTKDNVHIKIDSVLYWHIVDPYVATFNVSSVRKALIERTQTTLRHTIGTRTLQDSIENRETIAHEIQRVIEGPAGTWGVRIESILIKDLQFSQDLQETLSAAAKQKRIGESRVIAAAAEVESAKLMREASDILNTPAAMQIRYLETLQSMSKSAGTKVIFMPQSQGSGSMDAVVRQSVIDSM